MAKAIEYSKEYSPSAGEPSKRAKVGHIHGKLRATADKYIGAGAASSEVEFALIPKGAIIISGGASGGQAAGDLTDFEISGGGAIASGDVLSEDKLIQVKSSVNDNGGGLEDDLAMNIVYILE